MTWFTLEPHDPVLFRDGRPFSVDSDGARSLDFPPPSVIAGTFRSRIGFGLGSFTTVKDIAVAGPLLAEERPESETTEPHIWLPAPADQVLFNPKDLKDDQAVRYANLIEELKGDGWLRFRLTPSAAPWAGTSLPGHLRPIEGEDLPSAKAAPSNPFWSRETLRAWLENPPPSSDAFSKAQTREGLKHEPRVHVSINPETGTGLDGKLFKSDGLRFARRVQVERVIQSAESTDKSETEIERTEPVLRCWLLASCAHQGLGDGAQATLGGERRLATLRRAPDVDPTWPAPALSNRRARVVLLTPAIFAAGAVPNHIGGALVVAAAVRRAQVISGWDMAKNEPKGTRRMAPAGSVYWVEIPDGTDPSGWSASVHWKSVCDDAQDNLDGFGLAVVGVWP